MTMVFKDFKKPVTYKHIAYNIVTKYINPYKIYFYDTKIV